MHDVCQVATILRCDRVRWRLLQSVAELGLPDCWIAAGFVRNAVWDALHGRVAQPLLGDVDVIWFDPNRPDASLDREIEALLHVREPDVDWSVKNQARMHVRNGDEPYMSAANAMLYWPETATAIAARCSTSDHCEIASPLGLEDLLTLVLRPTPRFSAEKRTIFEERIQSKGWRRIWPLLTLAET